MEGLSVIQCVLIAAVSMAFGYYLGGIGGRGKAEQKNKSLTRKLEGCEDRLTLQARNPRMVRFVHSKGWEVSEWRGGAWVATYRKLSKDEAYWTAYGIEL